ncbi:MAG: translational GTPase TypA [Firmicutes bacterium]|nr:translational GTPase TypA [Bacillota bacterium]
MKEIGNIRNIAIVAHVDHGKTTLVDCMLHQGGAFRANQNVAERVMDNNDLEREKGITILAKNTSIYWNDIKINIVDTPGHADFSGEVERVLKMVNGVLLLVDSFEGPMPQTRFVLQKALEMNHQVIIVVNKIDRPDARPLDAALETLELLEELHAGEDQLNAPIIYCSARSGISTTDPDQSGSDLTPLFEAIVNHIPPPVADQEDSLQLLVSSVDYNDYVGRIGIGRVDRGEIRVGQTVSIVNYHDPERVVKGKINNLFAIEGLKRVPVECTRAGDIVCFSGIEGINIGDTVCQVERPEALPFVKVGEPTVEMTFSVNDSPFAGTEGDFVTSRQLRERLYKELLKDVSLRVFDTDSTDSFRVLGRGEMHLSILIENMRREGYEFSVSPPKALYKEIDGVLYEPMERLHVDVPEEYFHHVMEKMGERKGMLLSMEPSIGGRMKAEYMIPSRGLFGYRNDFLTDTRGEGIMGSVFAEYQEFKGKINKRESGSLVAWESGVAVTYGLFNAQERGQLFIEPGTKVYEGMIVGINPKNDEVSVNVCKKKQVSNMRASGSDEALRLSPPRRLSLEQCLEFLDDDELLEVTPKSLRLRKKVLSRTERLRIASKQKNS